MTNVAQEEKNTLDKPMYPNVQRRNSLVPPTSNGTPSISITSEDTHGTDRARRQSAHSLGSFSAYVSGFSENVSRQCSAVCNMERPRRPSTHSVGFLPQSSTVGEDSEQGRRPSTHSLGMFPLSSLGEDRLTGDFDQSRRNSAHSMGRFVVPVS